jgi:hypothetical protein
MVDFRQLLERRQRAHDRFDQGEEPLPVNRNVRITIAGSDYAVKFDRALLPVFKKAVPEHERRWVKDRYVWLVSPEAIEGVKTALEQATQTTIIVPAIPLAVPQTISRTFQLDYLGTTKSRGDKRKTAYGFVNGDWSAEFPEEVLRAFFEGREAGQKTGNMQTLYQVLCIVESVDAEAIKSAHRRLARQWHPDVCREDNAAEKFREIQEAYEVLINPEKRKRYDAGLYFERQGEDQNSFKKPVSQYGYRSPLRCGQITAIGTARLMRFVVSEIIKWDDVINPDGRVMTSMWPAGADTFQILWV